MKTKAHILVVEDKALIYKRLKMVLIENHYSVDGFTPSVDEAISKINLERPDLVLLDIDLQGERNGIELGNLLSYNYQIPFIYVTELDDDQTFYQSLQTKHDDFVSKKEINLTDSESTEYLVIQTKPHLDSKRLIRSIQTVLERHKDMSSFNKEAILAYVDYVNKTRNLGNEDVSQVPILYKDIAFITTNSDTVDDEKSNQRNKIVYKKMERNNSRLCTWDNKSYIVPDNLSPIYQVLPHYFIRISEDYIVNINTEMLDGRINGKRLKIRDKIFTISDTYKAEVEKRLDLFYQRMK